MRENFINQIEITEWCLLPSQTDVAKLNTLQPGNRVLVYVSDALMLFSLKGPQDPQKARWGCTCTVLSKGLPAP